MHTANNYYDDSSARFMQWLLAIVIGSAFTLSAFVILPSLNYKDPKNPDPVIELEFMPWQKVQPQPVKPKPVTKPVIKPKPKPVVKPKPKPIVKPKPEPKPIPKPVIVEKPAPEPPPVPIEEPEPVVEETPPEPVIEEPVEPQPQMETSTETEEVMPVPVPIFQLSNLPRFMRKVNPVYPPNLKLQGVNGKVRLSILIDATGKVRDIQVLDSSHPEFAAAAIEAIKSSSFQPADIDGKPVPTRYKIPFKFRLQ